MTSRRNIDEGRPSGPADRELWRRSRDCDAPAPSESGAAERFLDLAGFADGRLDEDDRERVAALAARDPALAADIAAAQAAADEAVSPASAAIVARAAALVDAPARERGRVIPFPAWRRPQPGLRGVAAWASTAAALVVAGWLGFAMGSDASLAFSRIQSNDDPFLSEIFSPSAGSQRDLTEGAQT